MMLCGIVAVAGVGWAATPELAGYTLALVLGLLAAARAVLPERRLPILALRSRVVDVTVCLGLAFLVAGVSVVLP